MGEELDCLIGVILSKTNFINYILLIKFFKLGIFLQILRFLQTIFRRPFFSASTFHVA